MSPPTNWTIALALAVGIGSCEVRTPAAPQTSGARDDAAAPRSVRLSKHELPLAPLFAYSVEAPLEREACAVTDQSQKIQGRIDRTVIKVAGEQLNLPLGSGRFLSVNGRRYLFCLEQHYRAPGSGSGPTGWHKGVTVYQAPELEKTAEIERAGQRSG